jgi:excisionase family DNA binding protein
MNKEQAAAALGITVRTLQRHMAAHRIGFAMRRTTTGEEATFSESEVARFKAERDALTTTVTPATNVSEVVRDESSQALQRAGNVEGITMLVSMLSDAMKATETQGSVASDVPLRDKMTLSFKEAARLSGVPESHLRAAFADGKLRGAKIGRGVRVTPDDVRKYVEGRMKAKR